MRVILDKRRMRPLHFRARALTAILIATAIPGAAAELRKDTVEAFDHYIADLEAHLERRWQGDGFLWSDSPPFHEELERGATLVQPAKGNGTIEIKGGLIQDWLGAIFIPSATLAAVLGVAQDYQHHHEIYEPEIASAQVRSHTGNEFVVSTRLVKSKLFLSDVLNTENDVRYVTVDPKRVYSRAHTTRVAEVTDPGKPNEHELPVGKDRGLLWRMYGYWFYEEENGGVVVECESVTLTRDVPFGMGKLLSPIIHGLPAESVRRGLDLTRKAVLNRMGAPEHRARELEK